MRVVEPGRDDSEEVVACCPDDPRQPYGFRFERTGRARGARGLIATEGKRAAAPSRERAGCDERKWLGGRRIRDPLAGVSHLAGRIGGRSVTVALMHLGGCRA